MSVSPRTVPQDGIIGHSLVTGERFDLNALADPGGFHAPPVFAKNPFQNTSQEIQTTHHHPHTIKNTAKVFASVTDNCHLTTIEDTCKETRRSKRSCFGILDDLEFSAGNHVTEKPSQISILQTIMHEHTDEPTSIVPPPSSIKTRSKSLPPSTLIRRGTYFNCVVTSKAAQDKNQEQHPRSTLPTASILQNNIPSNHSDAKSVAMSNSDYLTLTPEQTRINENKPLDVLKRDRDNMVDSRAYLNSRDIISTMEVKAQVTNGPCAEGSLPLPTTCTGKRSYHSDSDEVQFIIEVPRRHPKKMKRKHNEQRKPSPGRIHQSCSSTKESPPLTLRTNNIRPTTEIPQFKSIQENRMRVKRRESKRFPEMDKGILLKLSPSLHPPEAPLMQVKPLVGHSEILAASAQNPVTDLPNQAVTKLTVPMQPVASHFQDTNPDTSSIVSEQSPQLVPPKRGRPKKNTSPIQSGVPVSTKLLRSKKQDKGTVDLPTPKKQRRRGKGTVAAKRQNADKQKNPLAEGSTGSTMGAVESVLDNEMNSDRSYSTPMTSDGHQSSYTAIPWQPLDVPGGLVPSFTFPGLPFGYDWQQQTAQCYAQVYRNMQNPSQLSQISNRYQVEQKSTTVNDIHQYGNQVQQLESRTQSPRNNIHTFTSTPPLSTPPMQMPNAPQRKSSLYAVPPWSSQSDNMKTQVSSPMSPNFQQINNPYLVLNPQLPPETQLSLTQASQPVMQQPSYTLSHEQSCLKIPNGVTSSPKLPTEMLVDIAETCQVTFPFAKIAEKYNRPVQEVFDGFSAIIQIPLLKSAVDNRRVTEFASTKMEEFRKVKNGVFQLHERERRQLEGGRVQHQNCHSQSIERPEQLPSSHFHYPRHSLTNRRT